MKCTSPALLLLSVSLFLRCSCFGGLALDASSRNLLQQPTSEKQTWQIQFFGNPGKVSTDSSELHEGQPSLRIDQATAGTAFLNQKIPCKPSTRYRFSGWIKATKMVLPKEKEDQPTGAALAVYPGLGNSGWLSDTGKWVYAVVEFTTKPGQKEVLLGPRIGFQEIRPLGTAWFADLSLVELKGPKGGRR